MKLNRMVNNCKFFKLEKTKKNEADREESASRQEFEMLAKLAFEAVREGCLASFSGETISTNRVCMIPRRNYSDSHV